MSVTRLVSAFEKRSQASSGESESPAGLTESRHSSRRVRRVSRKEHGEGSDSASVCGSLRLERRIAGGHDREAHCKCSREHDRREEAKANENAVAEPAADEVVLVRRALRHHLARGPVKKGTTVDVKADLDRVAGAALCSEGRCATEHSPQSSGSRGAASTQVRCAKVARVASNSVYFGAHVGRVVAVGLESPQTSLETRSILRSSGNDN
eukprot:1881099-Rhodomonas_salina.2